MNNENDRFMPLPREETSPAHQITESELVDGNEWLRRAIAEDTVEAATGHEEQSPVTRDRGRT